MSYNRDIHANFYANDRGVTATLNRINGGLSNTSRMSGQAGQSMGYADKQIRAIGTTLRYAFAGEVVQRIRMAYQGLEQFQHGLADITALATQGGTSGLPLATSQLNELGHQAIRTSIMTGKGAADILESYRMIYSSIPGIKPGTVPKIGQLFTEAAQISETDPRTIGNALIQQMNAFGQVAEGQNPFPALQKDANEFFEVIRRSVGLTGDQLATMYGRVTSAAHLAKISQEDMNALIVMISRGGGSPGFFTRNLSQLLQRLPHPGGTAHSGARHAYAQAGISQEQAGSMGGLEILMRLLDHALRLSTGHGGLSPDEIKKLSQTPQGRQQIRDLGAKAFTGRGGIFVHEAIGSRIQSEQALQILAPMLGALKEERQAMKDAAKDTDSVHRAFQRWLEADPLESMANAMASFTTDLISQGDPLFRKLGQWTRAATLSMDTILHHATRDVGKVNRSIDHEAQHLMRGIPGAHLIGGHAAGIMEAAIGTFAVGTLAGRGKFGGLLSKFRKRGLGIAEVPLMAEAAAAGIANIANGTRSAPTWVVIHPLSWALMPKGVMGGGGTDGNGRWHIPFIGKIPNVFKKIPKFSVGDVAGLSKLIKIGGPAAAMAYYFGFPDEISGENNSGVHKYGEFGLDNRHVNWKTHRTLAYLTKNGRATSEEFQKFNPRRADVVSQFAHRKISADLAEQLLEAINRQANALQSPMALSGASGSQKMTGSMDVNITLRDPSGKVIGKETKKGVSTTFWKDGENPPNYKGKQVTRRHGN